jgi:hypothetical protein
MKSLTEHLGSLSLTTLTLSILLLWISGGILLNANPAFHAGFDTMNRTLLSEWLRVSNGEGTLKTWFVGLCLGMVLLAVNLVFCSWRRIYVLLRKNFTAVKALMLLVHFLFGCVALGHFTGFMFGYRHEEILLAEGQEFRPNPGHRVRAEKIQHASIPRDPGRSGHVSSVFDLNPQQHFAEVSLSEEGSETKRQKIPLMTSFRSGSLRVTLKGFAAGTNPQAVLVVSFNPTLQFFLTLYPLMIAGMILHLAITWEKPSNTNAMTLMKGD